MRIYKMKPILFCNIAWMRNYQGARGDKPIGGGSYVKENGTGSEVHNFNPKDGVIKGFVQVKKTINLQRLGADKKARLLEDVTVVWLASSPLRGTFIVGWYLHATLCAGKKTDPRFHYRQYNITAKSRNCYLLPIDRRTFEIPRGLGGVGESNVWYAENKPVRFFKDILSYIRSKGKIVKARRRIHPFAGGWRNRDPLKRQKVEAKAIRAVYRHFTSLGYQVKSFEKDNLGWDLQAHLNERNFLRLEVKGLSGEFILTELTPNEYRNMERHYDTYRICVVSKALRNPIISIFAYSPDHDNWEDDNGNVLDIQKIVSARIRPV